MGPEGVTKKPEFRLLAGSRRDREDIEPIGRFQQSVLSKIGVRCAHDAPLFCRTNGIFRGSRGVERLYFYEDKHVSIPGNQIDLAASSPIAGCHDSKTA
jgi:hypothetical protein